MKTLTFNAAQQAEKINNYLPANSQDNITNINWFAMFMNYCKNQQYNRLQWLAAAITIQGCVLAPVTLMFVLLNGNMFSLWIPVILAFAATETTNLAALPTKITIPVFFAGIIIDILVIAASFIF